MCVDEIVHVIFGCLYYDVAKVQKKSVWRTKNEELFVLSEKSYNFV